MVVGRKEEGDEKKRRGERSGRVGGEEEFSKKAVLSHWTFESNTRGKLYLYLYLYLHLSVYIWKTFSHSIKTPWFGEDLQTLFLTVYYTIALIFVCRRTCTPALKFEVLVIVMQWQVILGLENLRQRRAQKRLELCLTSPPFLAVTRWEGEETFPSSIGC